MRKAVVGATLAVALVRARTGLRNLGATEAERWATLPGDEIVPAAKSPSTMANTIDMPPSEVWPWLVQMGCDRAGFYSWDRLDNGGRPSATGIHPEWQGLAAGDRYCARRTGASGSTSSAWSRSVCSSCGRRSTFAAGGSSTRRGPRFFSEGVWAFVLDELPGGKTRLVVRSFGIARPRMPLGAVNLVFWEPVHVVMQTRQLRNLKRLAESPRQESVLVAAA